MRSNLIFFLTVFALVSCVKFKKADLVIHNAKIYTVNETFEVAQAMAIKDGIIVAVGKEHEIMNKYRADKLIDAETRPIYPGFIDGHCHFLGAGLNSLAIDLSEASSMEEIVSKLKESSNQKLATSWLIGYGWNENKWEDSKLSNELLNKEFSDIPVLLWRVDGHSLLVNEEAIELSGIEEIIGQSAVENEIVSGIVKEDYIFYFSEAINYTDQQKKDGLRASESACFENGITTVTEAGLSVEELELIQSMQASNVLSMRFYAMLFATDKALSKEPIHSDRLHFNSYKVMLDGSVGSQSACFKKPYLNSDSYGNLLMSRENFSDITQRVYDKGAQLNVHCIGDSAVKVALEEMGKVLKESNGLSWRIEHAQCVDEVDLPLFAQYSILASVQPTHLIDDYEMVQNKLTKQALKNSYRLRTLLEQNGIIVLGTDFPVASKNPIETFYNAVVRVSDKENQVVSENEKLSREEALKGITFWSAMANQDYEKKGSIEVGKVADFVMLTRDIMKVPEEEIKSSKPVFTFLGGEKVFEAM